MTEAEELTQAIQAAATMAALLNGFSIEVRLAIIGQLGETCCGLVGLAEQIKRAMEQYNNSVEGNYDA